MNDQQHAFWLAYIRQLADLLGLRDYEAGLLREPPENPDAVAFIWTIPDVFNFSVRLSERFLHLTSPEEQRQMITHELLHVHLTAIDAHVRWGVKHLPADSLVDALPDLIRMDIERATDALSHAIARFLPLPIKYSEYAEFGDKHITSELRPAMSTGYNGSIHESIDRMARVPTNGAVR